LYVLYFICERCVSVCQILPGMKIIVFGDVLPSSKNTIFGLLHSEDGGNTV
jgi:hypothetical protein